MHSKGNLHDDFLKGLKVQGLWIIKQLVNVIEHMLLSVCDAYVEIEKRAEMRIELLFAAQHDLVVLRAPFHHYHVFCDKHSLRR